MKFKSEQFHIPWTKEELKVLLLEAIKRGETVKVDFKRSIDLTNKNSKSEFIKDVCAIANSFHREYDNYGFIIIGAENNNVVYSNFSQNEDNLQATIDEILKHHVGPFVITQVYIFEESDNKKWGVVVIPPTHTAPHIILKDMTTISRGDIYVRRGTTTEKALPDDFVRFFRQYLEEHEWKIYELSRTIDNLSNRIDILESDYSNNQVEQYQENREKDIEKKEDEKDQKNLNRIKNKKLTLTKTIKFILAKEEDAVTRKFFIEAKKINNFLSSDEIPWAIQPAEQEKSKEIFSKLENISEELWEAIAELILKDNKGKYENTLINVIDYLAYQVEVPVGVPFNDLGKNVRYFPLFIALYIIFITATFKKRYKLLKNILSIELKSKDPYKESVPLSYILFFVRRSENVFHPLYDSYPNRKWCDPVASYTKILLDRILNPDELMWDSDREFYIGEFILCLSPLDILSKEMNRPIIGHPSSGLYLYISNAVPIIENFLAKERDGLAKIFDRPLGDILKNFDNTAKDLGSGMCWGDGFRHGAFKAAFPEKHKN